MDDLQGVKKIGIVDCGTNTFNLLVVSASNPNDWSRIFSTSVAVKLAPHPETGNVGVNRMARGIDALHSLKNSLINLGADHVKCVATSAIREAENGMEFIEHAGKDPGLNIEIIDGNREAELIYKGVNSSGLLGDDDQLIIDIGGGSVEFIIGNARESKWKTSKAIGVSRLKGSIRPSDPMKEEEISELFTLFKSGLEEVKEHCMSYGIDSMIGCSGAFDSFATMIASQYPERIKLPLDIYNEIPIDLFDELHEELIGSTIEERLFIPGLVPMRADMIVLSSLLVKYCIDSFDIKKLTHTSYALREGLVADEISKMGDWNEN